MNQKKGPFTRLYEWFNERIDVNQIFGSVGLGLYSPRAIDRIRSRILFCGMMPITMAFISVLPP